MARVLVCKDGKVIEGREALFEKMIQKEMKHLADIWKDLQNLMDFDAETVKEVESLDPYKSAKESLIVASYRLGNGKIWMEESS